MSWRDLLKGFLRQCTYALAFFVAIVLVAEYVAPASVTPFIDPLPFAILSLALLSADAMRRSVTPNRWIRSVFFVIAIVMSILIFFMR